MRRTVFLCSRKREQHYIINITQIKQIDGNSEPKKDLDAAIKAVENDVPSQSDIIALNNHILQIPR